MEEELTSSLQLQVLLDFSSWRRREESAVPSLWSHWDIGQWETIINLENLPSFHSFGKVSVNTWLVNLQICEHQQGCAGTPLLLF